MRSTHFCTIFLLAAISFLVAAHPSLGVEKSDFLGRWDITLADTGDTFRCSWLEITETDAKLSGKLLWRWGSVIDAKSVEIVGDQIRVTRTERYEEKPVNVVYDARLLDGNLLGSVKKPEGSVFRFTGIHAVEKTDVSGTWQLTFSTPGGSYTPPLVLNQRGANVSGKYIRHLGNREFVIHSGKLEGTNLTFSITARPPERGPITMRYSAEIQGDRMTGTAQVEGRTPRMAFTGQRERKWGKPIQLFNGKDLTGWRPRDPKRPFHWSVKDGAMANRPPDQDIVSETEFHDFKLNVEFSLAEKSNSGIYLRGRYELQLLDDFGEKPGEHSNCSIYSRIAPSVNASKKAGQWQTLHATLVGQWLTVLLNGKTIMDNVHLDGITGGAIIPQGKQYNDQALPGPFMFQGDHGLVRFRKLEVTPALE